MLILTPCEIRKIEKTANDTLLSYEEMMEKAGKGCADFILAGYPESSKAVVLCGKGKNGGDGYVIARLLSRAGKKVRVINVFDCKSDELSEKMKFRLPPYVPVLPFAENCGTVEELISCADIIIDAVFGIGFSGELPGRAKKLFSLCKKSRAVKIAIDIPSGLSTENPDISSCFSADCTLSMMAYKKEHAYKPWSGMCGETHVIPIGFSVKSSSCISAVTLGDVKDIIKKRDFDANKGTYGNALIIAGSKNMPGAAIIAANSAVNSGAGLVTLAFPDCCYSAVTAHTSENVLKPLISAPDGSISAENAEWIINNAGRYSAIAAGCGMGVSKNAEIIIKTLIKNYSGFLLLDADGINNICGNINILKEARGNIVLTPHPGEMSRLTGLSIREINENREAIAAQFADFYNVTILLKGANTVTATKDGRLFVNTSGNPSMSRGGMGDMLTGLIVSLKAQGLNDTDAVTAGAYIHGLAGDVAAKKHSEFCATVNKTQECISDAFLKITEGK